MLELLVGFATALRASGISCSQSELIDASQILGEIDFLNRDELRDSLRSAMVKDPLHIEAFDRLFDVFFSLRSFDSAESEDDPGNPKEGDYQDDIDLTDFLAKALLQNDRDKLSRYVRQAVSRFGGIEKGRAVSGLYYAYRTLRQIDLDRLLALLEGALDLESGSDFDRKLHKLDAKRLIDLLKAQVTKEVTELLVEDRGPVAVAKTLAVTLPEDIEIVRASREELARMQRTVEPLARKLAARLAQKHRSQNRGQVDMRKTMRASLSYGGTPVELVTKPPRPHKPEIFLVTDVSGSVASFSRFTMQLVFAMSSQFSKVRSFAFIDEVDEVTSYFNSASDINEAMRLVNTQAKVVWLDGHSDYGRCLESFWERYHSDLTRRSSVIICGDARNNYHSAKPEVLKLIKGASKHLYWLNPEPHAYWNSGDSVISSYAQYCDGVYEVRSLRHLERFITEAI